MFLVTINYTPKKLVQGKPSPSEHEKPVRNLNMLATEKETSTKSTKNFVRRKFAGVSFAEF